MRHLLCACALLSAVATPALAAQTTASATLEYTDFSDGFGDRLVGEASVTGRWSATTLTFDLAHGRRDYGDEDFSGTRGRATLYQDWSDRFYTRTSVALATNSPVFPGHDISQEVNYKFLPNAVATGAVRHIRYYRGRDALALSAGGTYYFKGGFGSYRYTSYDVEGVGRTHGHLATVRINDSAGRGETQLWLGAGNSLHDYDWLPETSRGRVRSVALRRVQPIKDRIALDLTVGKSWHDAGAVDYDGTSIRVGLVLLR